MAGSHKGSSMKGQPEKSKECVSEATISKLLKDFNCADLQISTKPSETQTPRSSAEEEAHPNYEEIVSSLKHLHLKKPINGRSKLKEKKNFGRKVKAVSADKYNLSVAAVSAQKSILWPGKLNEMSRRNSSPSFLQPSKLSLSQGACQHQCSSSFAPSFHTSSSEEKSRIANSLSKLDQLSFGSSTQQKGNYQTSFSELSERNAKKSLERCPPVNHQDSCALSSSSTSASVKCECANPPQPITSRQCFPPHQDNTQSCNLPVFSSYRLPQPHRSSEGYSHFNETFSSGNIDRGSMTLPNNSAFVWNVARNCQAEAASVPEPTALCSNQSFGFAPATNSLAPERSCSEEVRMEESNVNELASYFEDLLHIPRKMSVMAEMMYA